MTSLVRINKNKSVWKPADKEILKAYKREYRKLPALGDDVSDDSEGEGEDGDVESAASSDAD